MKPDFALSLSIDGIVLLQRASSVGGPAKGWYRLGDVPLSESDLAGAMQRLRADHGFAPETGEGPDVKLMLPADQVRFLEIDAPTDPVQSRAAVESALDGATPYDVADLAFDWAPSGGKIFIAAVARETLAEAENFAIEYDFVPLGFATVPPNPNQFPREPFFGPSKKALTSLTPGVSVAGDSDIQSEIKDTRAKEPAPKPKAPEQPVQQKQAEPKPVEPKPQPKPETASDAPKEPAKPKAQKPTPENAAGGPQVPKQKAPKAVAKEGKPKKAPEAVKPKPADKGEGAAPKAPNPGKAKQAQKQPPAAKPAPAAAPKEVEPTPGFASVRARRDAPKGAAKKLVADRTPVEAPKNNDGETSKRRISLATTVDDLAETARESFSKRPKAEQPPETPEADTAPSAPSAGQRAASVATSAIARASTGLGKGIGFVSRRKSKPSKTANVQPALGNKARLGRGAAAAISAENTMDEGERMTVFGARKSAKVGGKPRFLGLMLTAALLVFLLGVAAWASIFLDNGLASLFGRKETPVVASVVPEVQQAEIDEVIPETAPVVPETALSLPEIESELDQEQVNLASLSAGVPTLSEELIHGQLDGLSVPFEAEALTPEQAEARYAATGIWQRAPAPPAEPLQSVLRDLYVASIDPSINQGDAVAIPTAREAQTDLIPAAQRNPLPPDAGVEFDDDGLIRPTPEGVVVPGGFTLVLGPPPLKPPARAGSNADGTSDAETAVAPPAPEVDATLAAFRPKPRPGDLIEQNERANLGGISLKELGAKRPRLRPAESEEKTIAEADETATEFAVASSIKPSRRPSGFASLVEKARKDPANEVVQAAAIVAPRTVKPKIPSSASVAREATIKNAINLRKVNLIGVYGKPSSRRALIRLSNGRYKKVKVGDRIDGGRVAAIGESQLSYTKSGRNVVLRMPKG